MQNDLVSVEWKEFKISDVFKIVNSKAYHKTELKIKDGTIPYITRTSFNNGLECCIINNNFKLNPKNTISFGAENADFFYQEQEYITGNKMYFLQNESVNRYTGLFLVRILQSSIKNCGFGYGKGLTGTRLKNRTLILPIDSKGNPNWQFMESYMKNIEQKYIKDILEYYNKKIADNCGGGGKTSSFSYLLNTHSEYPNTLQQRIFIEDGLMKIANEQLSLENLEWKEFIIGEIFEVKATLSGIDKNKLNSKIGNYPYITRSDKINGIDSFIAKQDSYRCNEANVITIGLDTQTAFYQSNKFYTGQNIQILTYKELNKYNALFIIILLKKLMEKFSWGGNGATLTRLKRGKIILPIDSKGNPDYKFMESYMKAIEKEHLEKITAYYNAKLAQVDNGGGVIFTLDEYKNFIEQGKSKSIQWKEFYFADIFKEIKRGKRLIKDNQIQGETPYVSSSAFNNGVDNFIDNRKNVRKFSDCISLANSGSVGSAFFHSYEFIASDHVTQLIQPKFNKYIYLFLLPIITRLNAKYSFNREINDKRIKREKLLLPIDSKGNPDWQFMESYMKDIESKKMQDILKYYQEKQVP